MMCQKGASPYRLKANPSGGAAEKSVLVVCAQSKINRKKLSTRRLLSHEQVFLQRWKPRPVFLKRHSERLPTSISGISWQVIVAPLTKTQLAPIQAWSLGVRVLWSIGFLTNSVLQARECRNSPTLPRKEAQAKLKVLWLLQHHDTRPRDRTLESGQMCLGWHQRLCRRQHRLRRPIAGVVSQASTKISSCANRSIRSSTDLPWPSKRTLGWLSTSVGKKTRKRRSTDQSCQLMWAPLRSLLARKSTSLVNSTRRKKHLAAKRRMGQVRRARETATSSCSWLSRWTAFLQC